MINLMMDTGRWLEEALTWSRRHDGYLQKSPSFLIEFAQKSTLPSNNRNGRKRGWMKYYL